MSERSHTDSGVCDLTFSVIYVDSRNGIRHIPVFETIELIDSVRSRRRIGENSKRRADHRNRVLSIETDTVLACLPLPESAYVTASEGPAVGIQRTLLRR